MARRHHCRAEERRDASGLANRPRSLVLSAIQRACHAYMHISPCSNSHARSRVCVLKLNLLHPDLAPAPRLPAGAARLAVASTWDLVAPALEPKHRHQQLAHQQTNASSERSRTPEPRIKFTALGTQTLPWHLTTMLCARVVVISHQASAERAGRGRSETSFDTAARRLVPSCCHCQPWGHRPRRAALEVAASDTAHSPAALQSCPAGRVGDATGGRAPPCSTAPDGRPQRQADTVGWRGHRQVLVLLAALRFRKRHTWTPGYPPAVPASQACSSLCRPSPFHETDYTMRDVERLHDDEKARKFHLPADMGQWDGESPGASPFGHSPLDQPALIGQAASSSCTGTAVLRSGLWWTACTSK